MADTETLNAGETVSDGQPPHDPQGPAASVDPGAHAPDPEAKTSTGDPDDLVRVLTANGWRLNVLRAVADGAEDLEIIDESPYREDGRRRGPVGPDTDDRDKNDYDDLTLVELRAEIDVRNHRLAPEAPKLKVSGTKADLVQVLRDSDATAIGGPGFARTGDGTAVEIPHTA